MKGNFDSLINGPIPVIVDFHAEWCSPCKMQAPVLKEIADDYVKRVRVLKIDIDMNAVIAKRYNIQSVPTLMIFKNGNALYRQAGVHSKPQLKTILDKLL